MGCHSLLPKNSDSHSGDASSGRYVCPVSDRQGTGSLDTEAQSSTWQSLARHQGSVETDFLNGEIVRTARKLGKQAPINEKLVRISQEMAANHEPPGKYTPAELSVMLGLDNKD